MAELVQKKGWLKSKILAYDQGAKGIDNTILSEGLPTYAAAPCEIVVPTPQGGRNNTYIVFGRDRPGVKSSGYGGKGASHAGAISIVAGRRGQEAADLNEKNEIIYADPDHRTDAAFIYLSQKTNIDENLGIKPEIAPQAMAGTGEAITPITGWSQSEAKSGIILKADNVRMVARQKIKLVTGTDNKLSTDTESLAVYGIDLIAGNDPSDLQAIVKGENLRSCLLDLKKELSLLVGNLAGFIGYQLDFNVATLNHFHIVPGPGQMPTSKSNITPNDTLKECGPVSNTRIVDRTLNSLKNQKNNLNVLETTYLQRGHAKDGKTKYINSLYNTVN
jgi:hypothetical protein